ncbi:hypothetical protein [Actinoplanes sp. NPDC026623]|uniref:hypothetical protein n=1 Tax=Actinoplanes sp. NPDC026623 TaxID=3155610 RepID=UPI0033CF3CFB
MITAPRRDLVSRAGYAVGSGGTPAQRWAVAWLPADPGERVLRVGAFEAALRPPRSLGTRGGLLRWAPGVRRERGLSFWDPSAVRPVVGVHTGPPDRLIEFPADAAALVAALDAGLPFTEARSAAAELFGDDGLPVLATLVAHGMLSGAAQGDPGAWTAASLSCNPFVDAGHDADGWYVYCPITHVTVRTPPVAGDLLSLCRGAGAPYADLTELAPPRRRADLAVVLRRLAERAVLLPIDPGENHGG